MLKNVKTQKFVEYLREEWLKEHPIQAWADQHRNLGIQITSRGEATHFYINCYLSIKKSKGNIFTSWLHIEVAVIS